MTRMPTSKRKPQSPPAGVRVFVTELGPRPVELYLKITLARATNRRGKPRVRVTIDDLPALKRRAADPNG
jgi:glutamine synthetase type III